MKLSELKPCAICGGPLVHPPMGNWYVLRVSQAMVNPRAANETLGLMQYFNGALGLAEAFAPHSEKAVMILGDEEPALLNEVHVCAACYHGMERRRNTRPAANWWRRVLERICGRFAPRTFWTGHGLEDLPSAIERLNREDAERKEAAEARKAGAPR